jgi:hypothetical protein
MCIELRVGTCFSEQWGGRLKLAGLAMEYSEFIPEIIRN